MNQDKDVIIEAIGLSKTYRVFHGMGRGRLLSRFSCRRNRSRFYQETKALDDVSFLLKRGEVMGVIGRNGSGKSTLLKLVAGLSLPTSGHLAVAGKVRALLSLGINFHPQFSGRENVIMGSMTMGIGRAEAESRMDSILDFAELRAHAEMPIQYYSNGMRARLAAAVAFQESPEILIIDEALAAGDSYFINKCLRRIGEICSSGSTIIFVTHGLDLIERLCDTAMLLDEGRLVTAGAPSNVVNAYRRILVEHEERQIASVAGPMVRGESPSGLAEETAVSAPASVVGEGISGTGEIELLDFCMSGRDGKSRNIFYHGEDLVVTVRFRSKTKLEQVRFFLELYSEYFGVRVAEFGTTYRAAESEESSVFVLNEVDGLYELKVDLPNNPLGGGTYYWGIYFAPMSHLMDINAQSRYYVQAYRVHPFASYSFPGEEWARNRKSLLEPGVRIQLSSLESGVRAKE